MFYSIKQGLNESTPSYVARFRSVADLQRSISDISDTDMIVRLSLGVTNQTALLARGIADSMNLTDFNQYCVQLLNCTNALSSFNNSNYNQERKINQNSADGTFDSNKNGSKFITRCGGTDHDISICNRAVKYPCKWCNQSDHYSRACPKFKDKSKKTNGNSRYPSQRKIGNPDGALTNNLIDAAGDSDISNNTTDIKISLNCNSINDRLIDRSKDNEQLFSFFGKDNHCLEIPGLLDTGAAGNFIRKDKAFQMCHEKIIRKRHIHELKEPVTVTYGNDQSEKISTYVTLTVSDSVGCKHEILAFVTTNCNYPFILGRPGLKAIGLTLGKESVIDNGSINKHENETAFSIMENNSISVPKNDHVITTPTNTNENVEVSDGGLLSISTDSRGKHIVASHKLLEAALITPYRSQRRPRSIIDHHIIHAKLQLMAKQFKVKRVESHQCLVVLEIVLVDKIPGVRKFPDDNLEKRYRITLDLRALNQMSLVIKENMVLFVPKEIDSSHKDFSDDKNSEPQHQFSAMETLKWLQNDINTPTAYGKIDISDAYQSIRVPPCLARLFCYACQTSEGIEYYQFTTLPQGWKYSPLLFSISIEYISNLCSSDLKKLNVSARHFQDDILLKSTNTLLIRSAIKIIQDKLTEFGFSVNNDKTIISDSLTFCGLHLSNNGVTPAPKCPLTQQLVDYQWNLLITTRKKEKQVEILQQIIGRINYLRGYLSGSILSKLSNLYKAVSDLLKGNIVDFTRLLAFYNDVCHSVLGGTFILSFGLLQNSLFSVIVTDANFGGFAGTIYKLVSSKHENNSVEQSIINVLKDELKLSSDLNYCLVPLKLTGGTFTDVEKRQSSTYRERLAMLRVLEEFYQYVDTPCVMISDNQNCKLTWKNVDEFLTHAGELNKGSLFISWIRFISLVSHIIWVPRNTSEVALVDELARAISKSPSQNNVPCNKLNKVPIDKPDPVSGNLNAADVLSDSPDSSSDFSNIPTPLPIHNFRLPILFDRFRNDIIESYSRDTTSYLDVKMAEIYEHLSHGTAQNQKIVNLSRRFVLHDNILYHVNFNGISKVFVPDGGKILIKTGDETYSGSLRAYILHTYHDENIHGGYQKLIYQISQNFWWPSLIGDALKYVKSCLICIENKSRFTRYVGDLRSTTSNTPFSCLIIDYCTIGDQPILVIADSFSSYCSLIPTDDMTAESTAKAILDFGSKFGFPDTIASDRGTSFVNHVIDEFSNQLSISWKLSSSYSPRSQGLAERIVQALKQCLCLIQSDGNSLKIQVGLIQLFHNCSNIGSIPFSPYQIVFGRDPKTELINGHLEASSDYLLRSIETRELFHTFREIMRSRVHDSYAVKSSISPVDVGDLVYRIYLTGGMDNKKISGPHKVLEKLKGDRFKIENHDYAIPSYQLKVVPNRPREISMENLNETRTLSNNIDHSKFSVNDLIAHEDSTEINCIDVSQINSIDSEHKVLKCTRFWYDQGSQTWNLWEGEHIDIAFNQVIYHPLRLIKGKIPKNVQRALLN